MDKKIETTKNELIEAFQKWNEDYLQNPDGFKEVDDPKTTAEEQTDTLLKYLNA